MTTAVKTEKPSRESLEEFIALSRFCGTPKQEDALIDAALKTTDPVGYLRKRLPPPDSETDAADEPPTGDAALCKIEDWIKNDGHYTQGKLENDLGLAREAFDKAARLRLGPRTSGGAYEGKHILGWIRENNIPIRFSADVVSVIKRIHPERFAAPAEETKKSKPERKSALTMAREIEQQEAAGLRKDTSVGLVEYIEILRREAAGKSTPEDGVNLHELLTELNVPSEQAAKDLETVKRAIEYEGLHDQVNDYAERRKAAIVEHTKIKERCEKELKKSYMVRHRAEHEFNHVKNARIRLLDLQRERGQLFRNDADGVPRLLAAPSKK